MSPPFFIRSVQSPKAIVMILGPLNVSRGSLETMADLYPSCSIVAASSPPLRFVLNWSLQSTVHDILINAHELCNKHPDVPIVSHAFSNGGAFLLERIERTVHLDTVDSLNSRTNDTYGLAWDNAELLERMRQGVQIFDSCPCYVRLAWDWNHWSDSFPHPSLSRASRLVYTAGASMSLTAWSVCTLAVNYPNRFWRTMEQSKTCMHQVYMYSKCDLLSDAAAVDRLVEYRRSVIGSNCIVHAYDDSNHCRLHVDHPDEYAKAIEDALRSMHERRGAS